MNKILENGSKIQIEKDGLETLISHLLAAHYRPSSSPASQKPPLRRDPSEAISVKKGINNGKLTKLT